jgi:pimeloyl-ACP methyl ester carboxylesterase
VPYAEAAGGARLYYELTGEGPLVLLVHGGTGTGAYDWEFQRERLAQRYRLLVPDVRGHGRSSDPEWLLGIDQIGEDVLRLIEEVGERPAAVIAFSIGATAVLRLLVRRPDVTDAFIAIGPSLRPYPERVDEIDKGPWPAKLVALEHEHGEDANHWRRLRSRLVRSVWRDSEALTDEELAGLTIPTLAVYGDRDPIEPPDTGLGLARALPRGELLVLPDAGHFVTRDRPEEFIVAAEGFLARHIARPDPPAS